MGKPDRVQLRSNGSLSAAGVLPRADGELRGRFLGSLPRASFLGSPGFLLSCLLLVFAVWILSLPLFPTQDGPMHRYYVHVLDSLLHGQATYNVYQIRHPMPPYLTHYGTLLALFRVLPYDWAEKVFTCITLFCFAFGVWLSAKEIGPAGRWAALFSTPLLLGFPLMMGFFNFTLGLGLLLLCIAFWQRIPRNGGRALLFFALFLVVLTFTHPIPLLLLIVLCGCDLLLSFLLRMPGLNGASWALGRRLQLFGLLLSILAAAFPMLAVDASKTSSTLHLFGFHPEFLRTSLLLTGLSPYNTRSHALSINLYRITLYLIFAIAMVVGARACVRAVYSRRPSFGTTLFLATVVLALALPFLPNTVNGSDYFATRLVFSAVAWRPVGGRRRTFAQPPSKPPFVCSCRALRRSCPLPGAKVSPSGRPEYSRG